MASKRVMTKRSFAIGRSSYGRPKTIVTEAPIDCKKLTTEDITSKLFIQESKTKCSMELDISNYLEDLRKRYPKISKFKKTARFSPYVGDLYVSTFIKYGKDNPSLCRDVVLTDEHFDNLKNLDKKNKKETSHPNFYSITILDKDFAFVLRYNYISDEKSSYLFFNDQQKIIDRFFKDKTKYYNPDIYELCLDPQRGYYIEKIKIVFLDKPIFSDNISETLNNDITLFFDNEKFYNDNNLPYKRGIILHGPHGNGKTTFIKNTLNNHPNTYRLLVDCRLFSSDLYKFINSVFPEEGNKIIVFEDLESISEGDNNSYSKRSSFLNFIDGAKTMSRTLFLATTNYPEFVDPALIDRPSRFDRIYRIDIPNESSRKQFLLKYFPELEGDGKLEEYVEKTKGFSGAYFKELFIMVGVQKISITEAITSILKQMKMCKDKKFDKKSSSIGLGGCPEVCEADESYPPNY